MRLAVINPNATASMTRSIAEAARAATASDIEIIALTNESGPASIQGVVDGVHAIPGLLDLIERHGDADAFIIACFDDTGLDAARCVAAGPVVGIGEAGCHAASLVAHRFSVITTLSRSVPILRNNLDMHGLSRKCASILATGVPVLALENASGEVLQGINATIRMAIERDGAEAIVLGCAGMAGMTRQLSQTYGIPFIDGVASAVGLAAGLVRMGIATSRHGLYASAAPVA
ncbi:MAG: aspartate/glutamate racemase family protein [Pseudaminobacter sp.]